MPAAPHNHHRHAHHHHHHHHHGSETISYDRAFKWGVALNLGYIVVETVFGLVSSSLALLADAGHNLSDVLGLLLAWGASYLSRIKPTARRTYGWRSSSILAALLNGLLLLVAVGGIAWEAIRRLSRPEDIEGATMIWVAGIGVVINTATALLFFEGRKGDLNIRGAYLHMAADAAVSLGVVVAGLAVVLTGLTWIDSITSLIVAAVILWATWGLLTESLDLALQAVPRQINLVALRSHLAALPGVEQVHDLHVWAMSTTEIALTVHLVKPAIEDEDAMLARISDELQHEFGIGHVTIQIERSADAARCRQVADEAL